MNLIHRIYCRSTWWRRHVAELLPWALEGVDLCGAAVLELGSGPGLTTEWLLPRAGSVTAVESDAADAAALADRLPAVQVHHGDATDLPFGAATYDVVVCFTMLHHVQTSRLQDQLFGEAARVLRPGGLFAGSDSRWGPLFAVAHIGDTLHLVDPTGLPRRLRAAGFGSATTDQRRTAIRFRATI